MPEHNDWAPEPLRRVNYDLHDANDTPLSSGPENLMEYCDLDRLAACYNACAGVPTAVLENIAKHYTTRIFEEGGEWYCFKWHEVTIPKEAPDDSDTEA